MGILKWLKAWLTAAKRTGEGRLGNPDLYPIDLEALSADLGLLEKAKELGQSGLPAFDSKQLTGSEADIVRAIERHRQGNVEWAVRRLAVLSESVAKRQVTQEVQQARQADEEFGRKASQLLANHEAGLKDLERTAKDHQKELEQFRIEHRVTRQARQLTFAQAVGTYAFVAVFILLEGFANAFTFSVGLDGGLVQGFLLAMLFAAVNVVVAFFVGKFLIRQVFHRAWFRKFIGFLGVAIGAVFIIFMALLTMHYRDSLAAGREEAHSAALQAIILQPFVFGDIFSIILFVLTIFFGICAIGDGLYSDDLYPGYGAVSKQARESREEYESNLAEAREDLEGLKAEVLAEFEAVLSRCQGVIASIQNGIEDKRTTASRVATAMQDADNSLVALLRRFRTENEKHRGQVPRPPYFDEYPVLAPVPLPSFDVQADVAALDAQRSMVEALVAEAQAIRGRIQASFSQQFDSLKTLDANFARQEGANG